MQTPKKILIRLPNWIGDAVMASPIIELIHRKWPEAHITIIGLKSVIALFEQDPYVDSAIALQKNEPGKIVAQKIKEHKFDLGLLLTNSFSSAWLFFRARIKCRVGFSKDMRGILLSKSLPYPKDKTSEHMILTYQRLLKKIGIFEKAEPRLYLQEQEIEKAKTFLKEKGIDAKQIVIGINPTAAFGPAKCWLEDRYQELAQKLLEYPNVHLLFFGDTQSRDKLERICNSLSSRVHNLAGQTTIRELMALTKTCDLFLTNDSGPMHIACALNVPVVAIFGSTSLEATGPYHKSAPLYKKVSCSPCFKKECPIDFRCMKAISVEEVYTTILQELKKYSDKECQQIQAAKN